MTGSHPISPTAGGSTATRSPRAARTRSTSTHDPRPHFGLGQSEKADEVVVRWPDGARSVRKNVAARQFLVVRKGS
jgi:hypothetical protein